MMTTAKRKCLGFTLSKLSLRLDKRRCGWQPFNCRSTANKFALVAALGSEKEMSSRKPSRRVAYPAEIKRWDEPSSTNCADEISCDECPVVMVRLPCGGNWITSSGRFETLRIAVRGDSEIFTAKRLEVLPAGLHQTASWYRLRNSARTGKVNRYWPRSDYFEE